jgi:hypothetical protein
MSTHVFARAAAATLLTLVLCNASTAAEPAPSDPRLAESRQIVSEFQRRLKGELMAAVESGGMAGAIGVCSDVAPAIASELSREHGARVRRTSTKVRNAANLPDEFERAALRRFEKERDAEGEEFEVDDDGRARYLRAIPAQGLCLGCHGTEIPAAVIEKLDQKYPHDRARGYVQGDIRGAFSILWPVPSEPSASE